MNILSITPYIPYPPSFGGSVRIYNLLDRMSQHGHDIFLLSFHDEQGLGDPSGLDGICEDLVTLPRPAGAKRWKQIKSLLSLHSFQYLDHYSDDMNESMRRLIEKHDVDVILVEFSQMACLDFPSTIPVVIDQHNVEYDLIRRMAQRTPFSLRKVYNWVEAHKFKREELTYLQEADLALATSERDAQLMQDDVPGLQTAVIVNGVDTEHFKNPGRDPESNRLVFVGATHYFPNEDGIHFYMREIHERILDEIPDLQVYLVGGKPPAAVRAYESDHVTVTGFVDDVRPYIHRSSAFIVPLLIGGGTRFKVVEAMAAGTPVVTTSLGCEGIPLTDGQEALVADSPAAFSRAVVRLLTDPNLAESLRKNGLTFVREHFDWSVIGRQLQNELQAVRER